MKNIRDDTPCQAMLLVEVRGPSVLAVETYLHARLGCDAEASQPSSTTSISIYRATSGDHKVIFDRAKNG